MRSAILCSVALLLLAPVGMAGEHDAGPSYDGGFIDFEEDADAPHDLVAVRWSGVDGRIDVDLAAPADPEAGLTVVLYTGTAGSAEPDQAIILHTGPGGERALTVQNGSAPDDLVVDHHNATVTFLVSPWDAPCAFAVARTVTYPVGGQNVEDRIGAESIADAWNDGTTCNLDLTGAIDDSETNETPGPGILALLSALATLLLARRRTQR